jgi:hypothetical protein
VVAADAALADLAHSRRQIGSGAGVGSHRSGGNSSAALAYAFGEKCADAALADIAPSPRHIGSGAGVGGHRSGGNSSEALAYALAEKCVGAARHRVGDGAPNPLVSRTDRRRRTFPRADAELPDRVVAADAALADLAPSQR